MKKMTRRTALTTQAAAGDAFVLSRFSIGKPGPSANSKLNIAMIGAGNIAQMAHWGCKGDTIVALADVDSKGMQVKNRRELNAYIKEPVRKGWDSSEYI